jgi:Mg2+ and Co2+ transporter CorA
MFTKDLLNKIKSVTNEILFGAESFTTEKLKDSEVEVKYGVLEVGADVSMSSPQGDVPVEDGTHVLDSGVSFITVGGKVTEVIEAPATAEDEEVKEELAEEETKEEKVEEEVKEDLADDKTAELLAKIEALEAEIALIKDALKPEEPKEDEAFTKLQADVKQIAELLSAIAKTPVEFSKTDNRAESADSKNDKLKAMADIISMKK